MRAAAPVGLAKSTCRIGLVPGQMPGADEVVPNLFSTLQANALHAFYINALRLTCCSVPSIDRRCWYQCVSRCLRTSKAQGNDQNQHRHAWSERHTSALGQLKSAVVGTARAGNARRQQARTLGGLRAAGRQPQGQSNAPSMGTMLAPMLACRRSDPMLAPITNCMLA